MTRLHDFGGQMTGEHDCYPGTEDQPRGQRGSCEGCGSPTAYLPRKTGLCAPCAGDVRHGVPVGTEIQSRYETHRAEQSARSTEKRAAIRLHAAERRMTSDGIAEHHRGRALPSYLK